MKRHPPTVRTMGSYIVDFAPAWHDEMRKLKNRAKRVRKAWRAIGRKVGQT